MSDAPCCETRPGRRLVRPRSDARRTEDDEARTDDPRAELVGILESALSIEDKSKIDTVLERRQNEGPPRMDDADEAAIAAASGRIPMTDDERAEAHEDVFGRPPPDVARSHERLLALEREVRRLPERERGAVTKALREYPLLFVNCPHTRMFVDDDGDSDFDAAAAAARLAKYWESRRALFGDETCYAPGTLAPPDLADYRRFYLRNLAILDDPETDEMARADAELMIDVIRKRKATSLDEELRRMEQECWDDFNPEGHDDELLIDQLRKETAITMARESPYELKVQFLDVADMDEKGAAERMVRYWETGLRLFGPSLEERRSVTLQDLDDCSVLLELGLMRLMPSEDDFGRSVVAGRNFYAEERQEDSSLSITEERLSQLGINGNHFAKVVWYMLHAALERNACQRKGLVLVGRRVVTLRSIAKLKACTQAMMNVALCVPVKIRAVHILIYDNNSWWRNILPGLVSLFTLSLRMRLIMHSCPVEEFLDVLRIRFGIRADNLPVYLGGTVDEEYFVRWLEDRRRAGA